MSRIENISRRDFIKYSATAGVSALIHPPSREQNAARSRAGRIDVHHHCRTDIQGGGRGGPGADWTPAKSLEQMEKFGISTAMISATVPADPFYDGTEKSRSIARGVPLIRLRWRRCEALFHHLRSKNSSCRRIFNARLTGAMPSA